MFFDPVDIILVGTLQPGNIGSAARAMNSMGFTNLLLAEPRCSIDDRAYWMATHGCCILEQARIHDTLKESLAAVSYVYGMTSRSRRHRSVLSITEMRESALKHIAEGNRIAIVFGPEDHGLSNAALDLCNAVATIPSREEASSFNVSQAVLLICYELFTSSAVVRQTAVQRELAPIEKTEQMYDHLRETLLEIGFLDPQNPEIVLGKFRDILTRAGCTLKDVQLVRGVCRQIMWYVRNKP